MVEPRRGHSVAGLSFKWHPVLETGSKYAATMVANLPNLAAIVPTDSSVVSCESHVRNEKVRAEVGTSPVERLGAEPFVVEPHSTTKLGDLVYATFSAPLSKLLVSPLVTLFAVPSFMFVVLSPPLRRSDCNLSGAKSSP